MFGDEQIEEEGEEKVDWGDQEVDKRDARLVNQQNRKDHNVQESNNTILYKITWPRQISS